MSSIYTLYHHQYSICSIMVRYTFAVRGPPNDGVSDLHVSERVVNIFAEEQLSEHFLLAINPLGQVPVLTSPALRTPIADSLDITHYLAEFYPRLVPKAHRAEITSLLKDLHELNYFSLSFPGRESVAQGFKAAVVRRLNDEGEMSDGYRKALEFKIGILERDKIGGLTPAVTAAMSARARALMEKFESRLAASGPWIFGLESPSAVDAHLIPFIGRMRDVERDALIPEKLGKYADLAMEMEEWKRVMDGRRTMITK